MPNVIPRMELKLPEKYKGTFIEKWGEYISKFRFHYQVK
jgi:hypothetical protein